MAQKLPSPEGSHQGTTLHQFGITPDYDPRWAERFRGLRAEYLRALGRAGVQVVAVEHVGSTSVPGLAAKPVIDVDIVVAGEDVVAASEALTGLGFRPLGEVGIPDRWAFREPDRLAGTNTYVVIAGSLALRCAAAMPALRRHIRWAR